MHKGDGSFCVALPLPVSVARQPMGTILGGQRACSFKQVHRICYVLHVKPAFDATAELLFKTVRDSNSVRHNLQSHFLEKLIDRVVG